MSIEKADASGTGWGAYCEGSEASGSGNGHSEQKPSDHGLLGLLVTMSQRRNCDGWADAARVSSCVSPADVPMAVTL